MCLKFYFCCITGSVVIARYNFEEAPPVAVRRVQGKARPEFEISSPALIHRTVATIYLRYVMAMFLDIGAAFPYREVLAEKSQCAVKRRARRTRGRGRGGRTNAVLWL